MTIAGSADPRQPSRGHVYATCKPRLSSFPHYGSSSIRNISSEDSYRETRNFMFASCSVADIFECDEPLINRNKQTTET
jgi:hypothetical protein